MIRLLGGVIVSLFPAAAWAAAPADGASAPQGVFANPLIMIVPMIIIFYFLGIRPQKKKQQQHDKMIASITRGDTVITAGGFFGKVLDVLDDSYILEIDAGVKVRILKSSVSNKREGDDKSRPKKLRKKRRVIRHEIAAESEKPAQTAETPQASREEGVSAEENEALIENLRDSSERDAESRREVSEGNGGNTVNADAK